ncbi:hypothetical protein Tco_0618856 [Tanacetum coccineum]
MGTQPYPFDSEDHTEIFGPDARPRPPGKTRPAKKTKSETTESSAGSGSGSMKDVLNEELRHKNLSRVEFRDIWSNISRQWNVPAPSPVVSLIDCTNHS